MGVHTALWSQCCKRKTS